MRSKPRDVACVGFDELRLDEIVSFTLRLNLCSQRLMQKLGMQARGRGFFDYAGDGHD
jgi:RimJ/RimL family protein N-acetyltransferase